MGKGHLAVETLGCPPGSHTLIGSPPLECGENPVLPPINNRWQEGGGLADAIKDVHLLTSTEKGNHSGWVWLNQWSFKRGSSDQRPEASATPRVSLSLALKKSPALRTWVVPTTRGSLECILPFWVWRCEHSPVRTIILAFSVPELRTQPWGDLLKPPSLWQLVTQQNNKDTYTALSWTWAVWSLGGAQWAARSQIVGHSTSRKV